MYITTKFHPVKCYTENCDVLG